MNWPADAQSWMDVIDHAIVILGAIVLAAVPTVFAAKSHRSIKSVENQVKNAHTTNLRDDLDRAINAVEALTQDVRGLRRDLLLEEDHRRQQITDLRDELEHRTGKHRRP